MFSIRVLRASEITREKLGRLALWAAAFAVIVAGAMRYVAQPSFWLDEAFVAVSLREPSPQIIFAQLEYGQYFPRLYLACIAAIRELFGYHIWPLRLLPFLCFVIATVFWARLLEKRSRHLATLALFGAALLVGTSFWLDQAIQLKQYTFDVLLALIPFLISDEFFKETIVDGKRKTLLIALALGCLLSYTYPFAIGARVLGWYLHRGRREGWHVKTSAVIMLAVAMTLGLITVWLTDHRFNFNDRAAYLAYWNDCILSSCFEQGVGLAARLITKFLWGWHGRQPPVTAGMVILQILGIYWVIKRWKARDKTEDASWGSRSMGSIILLFGVILASGLVDYPICGGRTVLFTQIHTQILALEGALFILSFSNRRRAVESLMALFILVVFIYSGRAYINYVRSESAENLMPMLSLIKPDIANTVWVHPCSVAQVRALPEPLPVEQVLFGREAKGAKLERRSTGTEIAAPQPGQKAWIIWTHLSGEFCRKPLEQIRNQARSWQIIHEGPDRGLALAEF
ncbi:MAG TPA: hypothetical protein VJX74_08555 [Blastocatellia bacterium]|nr:hypothetical protein [Blastocatellia bacterium]